MAYVVAAFYRFTAIEDAAALRQSLKASFAGLELCGSLLIAPEGINGTLAGSEAAIDRMLEALADRAGLPREDVKFSHALEKPFNRLKIRLKREIITFAQPDVDPVRGAGTHVAPRDWNALIADPDVLLLDTRNSYETRLGTFSGARDPGIERFTDFPRYVRDHLGAAKRRKIAMFCTGGIRCEKASAFMKSQGFAEVYHLKGGILKYLEEVPPGESRWQGDCYVFDKRMAVGHGLATGNHTMCFGCGAALAQSDKERPEFEDGVSCAHCFALTSDADKARFRARHKAVSDPPVRPKDRA